MTLSGKATAMQKPQKGKQIWGWRVWNNEQIDVCILLKQGEPYSGKACTKVKGNFDMYRQADCIPDSADVLDASLYAGFGN